MVKYYLVEFVDRQPSSFKKCLNFSTLLRGLTTYTTQYNTTKDSCDAYLRMHRYCFSSHRLRTRCAIIVTDNKFPDMSTADLDYAKSVHQEYNKYICKLRSLTIQKVLK